ncbi:MAG: hypothetical protein KDK97_17450 [Verrucomicrobiales bacterium]|nr:hypothetical protein [Verrucomicrobiales bacterium]MCP5558262.1 hypothetical protein [Verrucomicrobiaceae bacterium]
MNRILVTLCVLLFAAAVTTAGWLLARPDPSAKKIAALEVALQEANSEVAKLKEELAKKPVASLPTSGPSKGAAGQTAGAPTVDDPSGPAGKTAKPSAGEAMRNMFRDPGMRALVEQQQLAQIEMLYGRLFDQLGLTPEEKANFKNLLGERTKAQMELGLKLMDPNLTPAKRKELAEGYKAYQAESDKAIEAFLNNKEDYTLFKRWEGTAGERTKIDMAGRSQFAAINQPLTPQQEEQLIDAMIVARQETPGIVNTQDPTAMDVNRMDDSFVDQQMKAMEAADAAALERARAFLTPEQLQAFAKMNEQFRVMAQAGLKASVAMFGKK